MFDQLTGFDKASGHRTGEQIPRRAWWVLCAGLAVLGTSAILIRYASEAPGLAVASWRTMFAAFLIGLVSWRRSSKEIRAIGRRDGFLILVAGVLLGLHIIGWVESLYHTSVASASVLVTSSPLFIAVLGFLFLRERLSWKALLAIVCGVGGAALMGTTDGGAAEFPRALFGDLLALTAAVLFAAYILIGRSVRERTSILAYLLPLYVAAALTCTVAAIARGVPLAQPPEILGLCLLMALGPQLLGHGAFNYAVRYIPATHVGVLSLTEPIGASLLALALFGEVPAMLAVAGMLVVMVSLGVLLLQRRPR